MYFFIFTCVSRHDKQSVYNRRRVGEASYSASCHIDHGCLRKSQRGQAASGPRRQCGIIFHWPLLGLYSSLSGHPSKDLFERLHNDLIFQGLSTSHKLFLQTTWVLWIVWVLRPKMFPQINASHFAKLPLKTEVMFLMTGLYMEKHFEGLNNWDSICVTVLLKPDCTSPSGPWKPKGWETYCTENWKLMKILYCGCSQRNKTCIEYVEKQ